MDRYTRNVLVVEPDPVERERLAAALEGEGFELPPGADEHDLLELIEELRIQRFEPSCPLWRVWLITGLPEGRVAMFVKLHHAVADGMAAMSTIGEPSSTQIRTSRSRRHARGHRRPLRPIVRC
jgi:hypothetical protein